MFKKVNPKVSFPKMEEKILEFWEQEKIFEKSVKQRDGAPRYSFYDGPPFATGTPHYGHIVASTIKDVVPRYWTMRGFQVERKWGWDCHGLPIENIAEKELGIKHKKEIEVLGVETFNETCRSKVLEYVAEWEKVIRRLGRWADMDHAYKTMDRDYMESVWWVFKELWDRGLIYESYRSMHICPRCETTLSQSEVAEGYKDVKDLSVVAKFELVDEPNAFVLAWTTTPWTLPGNVALAVNKEIDYVRIKINKLIKNKTGLQIKEGETYVVATDRVKDVFGLNMVDAKQENQDDYWKIDNATVKNDKLELEVGYEIFSGNELLGKSYKPLFDYYLKQYQDWVNKAGFKKLPESQVSEQLSKDLDKKLRDNTPKLTQEGKGYHSSASFYEEFNKWKNAYKIYEADFVNTEEGTGVVHIAPAFGEDDMNLGKEKDLPFVQHVNMDGTIKVEVGEGFAGLSVKPSENPQATDVEIIKYLAKKNFLFSKEKYEHSYPHCWRCDTPLLNYATSSWFVNVTKIKDRMLELARDIRWSPGHIKEGRFGKWLLGARDWSISRQRYWASVLPIWKCACGEMRVFGSVKELEETSGKKIADLHKHIVDGITFPCEKCGNVMKRIPDVLDTWFDSGSMPYASAHYPFEDTAAFEKIYPAQFIAEGVDQTRAWFYYLHVIGTGMKDSNAFQNVIVNGIVLAEDGKKMSKKLKNYPDPMAVLEKYGSDALRFYLLSSPVVAAENLNFSERDLADVQRNLFRMVWNSYAFFMTYATIDQWQPSESVALSKNILDRWILSELQLLVKEVNSSMEAYELNRSVRAFAPFVDHLSNWYIRRSRKRFWKSEDDSDKEQAYQTLYDVLVTLAKLMAPFTPFIAEEIYRNLTNENSVHLAEYPVADEGLIDEELNKNMQLARFIVSVGLQTRSEHGIKVRQPLKSVMARTIEMELQEIVKEELNVKEYIIDGDEQYKGSSNILDLTITPQLKLEGEAREIIRAIQEGRKKAGFNVEDRIVLGYNGKKEVFEMFGDMIAREVLATDVKSGEIADAEYTEEAKIEGESFHFWLKRV